MGSINAKYFNYYFNSGASVGQAFLPVLLAKTGTIAPSASIELVVLNLEGNTSASCLGRFH